MIKKADTELAFIQSDSPIRTVEVDLDSIPEECYGYERFVVAALQQFAVSNPSRRVTVYVCQRESINFHEQTFSAFIGVVGSREVLDTLLREFEKIRGTRARFSDSIMPSSGRCEFHVQDGYVWRPWEAFVWYANGVEDDNDDEPQEVQEWGVEPENGDRGLTRQAYPARFRTARSDASVGSIKRTIEQIFGLPEGSVALCEPGGRALRADATIRTLRSRWE